MEKERFKYRQRPCTPEQLESICEMLSRGLFRATVYDFLKIGKEKWDNWMRNPTFREAVLHAEASYFKAFQERWLGAAAESLPEAKEYATRRFADVLDPKRSQQDAPVKKVTLVIKKYTMKGVK